MMDSRLQKKKSPTLRHLLMWMRGLNLLKLKK
ncbi:hypothetical protein Golax_023405 [Gossypium laxum]|uniref:Uncharacterized protein n=1 Tax=Gossypium laxum TaxID=34288 RepID=A0A7J9B2J3_9ROSI|nr:hypothetical protein [Gossypium laxum]